MQRVLVTEKISQEGLNNLRNSGYVVDEKLDLSTENLMEEIVGAHAVIIRSATAITDEIMSKGEDLVVIGRAGIGLDNVDVESATKRGIMVVNAPKSNILSAAEHTLALLLSQARNIPPANEALKNGRWERSKWTGVELADKTLGIIGLGRIGKLVAQRALAFGMKLVAYDPYIAEERAQQLSVELVSLEQLMEVSDFVTIHVAKTPETINLINAESLSNAKPTLRIVNVARGGIINESDLANAVSSGQIAGAALDVFEQEPTLESPLFAQQSIVVTPHLGASTEEAQEKAGNTLAEQVDRALRGKFVPFAVNVSASEATEIVRPFLPRAEKLGALFLGLCEQLPENVNIDFAGEIGGYDNKITELSALKGLFSTSGETVSFVNAFSVAENQGVNINATNTTDSLDYLNTITISGGGHAIAGTVVGLKGEHRIIMVDDHTVDIPPSEHMVVLRNDDRPGVIGKVGTILGENQINITDMNVGRSVDGYGALMVISTQNAVSETVAEHLINTEGVTQCSIINLPI